MRKITRYKVTGTVTRNGEVYSATYEGETSLHARNKVKKQIHKECGYQVCITYFIEAV